MNKENILKVADAIEQHSIPDLGFNMQTYYSEQVYSDKSGHECETVACIAGWAAIVSGADRDEKTKFDQTAVAYLSLSEPEADLLFAPNDISIPITYGEVTPAIAVRVLRNAAETGLIDWHKAVTE